MTAVPWTMEYRLAVSISLAEGRIMAEAGLRGCAVDPG